MTISCGYYWAVAENEERGNERQNKTGAYGQRSRTEARGGECSRLGQGPTWKETGWGSRKSVFRDKRWGGGGLDRVRDRGQQTKVGGGWQKTTKAAM